MVREGVHGTKLDYKERLGQLRPECVSGRKEGGTEVNRYSRISNDRPTDRPTANDCPNNQPANQPPTLTHVGEICVVRRHIHNSDSYECSVSRAHPPECQRGCCVVVLVLSPWLCQSTDDDYYYPYAEE